MVVRAGLEPATTCLEGRCSIQLSYRTVCVLTFYNITSFGSFFKERAAPGADTAKVFSANDLKIFDLRPIFIIRKKICGQSAFNVNGGTFWLLPIWT